MLRARTWSEAAAVAVLAAAAGWFGWQAWRQSGRVAELSAAKADLQQRLESAERRTAAAEAAAQRLGAPAAPVPERAPARPAAPSTPPDETAAVQALRERLAQANATIARLDARLADAEAQIQKLSLEARRLSGSESSLSEDLSSANRLVEALQQEMKGKNDRVAGLEIEQQRLRQELGAAGRKAAETARLTEQLQDLYRRRENYLSNILRRYRELTDQYRSLAGSLDERRSEGRAIDNADLVRLQNSIGLAEEDLRQIKSLNAQAERLQKKLAP